MRSSRPTLVAGSLLSPIHTVVPRRSCLSALPVPRGEDSVLISLRASNVVQVRTSSMERCWTSALFKWCPWVLGVTLMDGLARCSISCARNAEEGQHHCPVPVSPSLELADEPLALTL